MGRLKVKQDPDRYLVERAGNYYYKRRVPAIVAAMDTRAPHVRLSLKTDDLAQARAMRDLYEAADDELWASMHQGGEADIAERRYQATVKRAQALGLVYRPVVEILQESLTDRIQRIEAAPVAMEQAARAALGVVDRPAVTVTKAFDLYRTEIVPHELASKSKGQKHRWELGKRHSIDQFKLIVGDLDMTEISRHDAQKFYKHYLARIAPPEGKATYTANHGNRRLGDMRVLYRAYFTYIGYPDRPNPFAGLSYKERTAKKRKRKRPPFPVAFIKEKILAVGALAGLNDQARAVLLTVIDTGARPSEICNLSEKHIRLDDPIPHIMIEPEDDPDDPREIKTDSSVRRMPLVGLALEAMKKHPKGFPRYRDKGDSLSAALNKFLKENELRPTSDHVVYSFRHTFEDRMKEAGIDAELRRILMGHSIDRPDYGEGGSLSLRQKELQKIVLPFDRSII